MRMTRLVELEKRQMSGRRDVFAKDDGKEYSKSPKSKRKRQSVAKWSKPEGGVLDLLDFLFEQPCLIKFILGSFKGRALMILLVTSLILPINLFKIES